MEQSKRIPARAMIECILCAKCGQYATATGGGICAACALTAERDQLRAEVGEVKEQRAYWEGAAIEMRGYKEAAERERDEAQAHAADLRGLLEWINQRGGCGLDVHNRIRAALSRTPAQSLNKLKAGVLRDEELRVHLIEQLLLNPQQLELTVERVMNDEADRLEATDGR